jgi:hypothetical protein
MITGFLQCYSGAVTAIATVAIGVFTFFLMYVTNRQARLTQESIDLTKQTLTLTYRPRLHVRNVVLRPPLFECGQLIHGQFYVSNVGGISACVVESHCEVLWDINGLPMERPYEGKRGNNPIGKNVVIAPGASYPGLFQSESTYEIKEVRGEPGIFAGGRLYVMGWIDYVDDLKVRRRTAFCRQYLYNPDAHGVRRFYPVEDPDYEYEE